MSKFTKLNSQEKRVIENKGTEPPYSGKFYQHDEPGIYVCKKCGAELFQANHKFQSSCGWPSFDGAVSGSVVRSLDADGIRTEITCANCGAHLGHVFEGEGLTVRNIRYCVNSISLNFIAKNDNDEAE